MAMPLKSRIILCLRNRATTASISEMATKCKVESNIPSWVEQNGSKDSPLGSDTDRSINGCKNALESVVASSPRTTMSSGMEIAISSGWWYWNFAVQKLKKRPWNTDNTTSGSSATRTIPKADQQHCNRWAKRNTLILELSQVCILAEMQYMQRAYHKSANGRHENRCRRSPWAIAKKSARSERIPSIGQSLLT